MGPIDGPATLTVEGGELVVVDIERGTALILRGKVDEAKKNWRTVDESMEDRLGTPASRASTNLLGLLLDIESIIEQALGDIYND